MGKSLIGNYEMFKEIVIETLKDYLPEAYQDMEMKLVPVKRVNKVKDGICFFGDGPISASPTIYRRYVCLLPGDPEPGCGTAVRRGVYGRGNGEAGCPGTARP